jgi:hypothetical protein
LAEGEGFEPPLPVKVKRFSRPPVSTAHTSLRVSVVSSLAALKNREKGHCRDFCRDSKFPGTPKSWSRLKFPAFPLLSSCAPAWDARSAVLW